MKERGCFSRLVFAGVLFVAFGASSYLWFTIFVRGRSVQTPELIGRDVSRASAIASDRGIELLIDNDRDRHSDKVPYGAIVWQNRPAGSLVKRGARIYAGQSLGPLILAVPDLSGQSPRTALLRFSQRNLKLGNISYLDHATGKNIMASNPPAGTVVKGQTAVSLLVAYPPVPMQFVMPDLIDRPIADVRPVLESAGLSVSNVRYESYPGILDGIIIRQYPLNGSPVSDRNPVSLVVSRQEQMSLEGAPPL